MKNSGFNIFAADYDGRTALHLSAAEGKANVVQFLIDSAAPGQQDSILAARDRWGGTPYDDAARGGHQKCVDLLRSVSAPSGSGDTNFKPMDAIDEARLPKVEGDV